jgi:hypothetical protein
MKFFTALGLGLVVGSVVLVGTVIGEDFATQNMVSKFDN